MKCKIIPKLLIQKIKSLDFKITRVHIIYFMKMKKERSKGNINGYKYKKKKGREEIMYKRGEIKASSIRGCVAWLLYHPSGDSWRRIPVTFLSIPGGSLGAGQLLRLEFAVAELLKPSSTHHFFLLLFYFIVCSSLDSWSDGCIREKIFVTYSVCFIFSTNLKRIFKVTYFRFYFRYRCKA